MKSIIGEMEFLLHSRANPLEFLGHLCKTRRFILMFLFYTLRREH